MSVAGSGDVNGDGLADVIVGASGGDAGSETNAGLSYVVFGKPGTGPVDLAALGSGGFVIEGVAAYDISGRSVAGAGDVNGDGLADLLVGGPRELIWGDGDFAGSSYVVFGKPGSAPIRLGALGGGGFTLAGAAANDYSGQSVSGAGDVNGDGLADLIIGAWSASPDGEFFAGSSYVVFSQQTPPPSAAYRSYARNGDSVVSAVGSSGDGSDHSSPGSRVWIDFDDGGESNNPASSHEVGLSRTAGPYGAAAADVHWQLRTDRRAWAGAELTLRYLDAELFTDDENALQIVRAPTAAGPYTPLPSIVNAADNTISAVVDELGYFFVTRVPDSIFANGFESVAKVGTVP